MKLLHFADLHIGMTNYSKLDPETGLESRLVDFLKTFDFIVDTAIKEEVDAVLFAGDAYKSRDPTPTQQRGFGERIKRLAKNHMPVILVVGNHDTPNADGKANTLDIYSALEIENVFVCRKPQFLNINTKSGNLQIIAIPWLQKEKYKTIGEELVSFYEKRNKKDPAVLVGHLEVEGASFGSEKGLAITNDVTVPLSLLTERRLAYVALGHIHKHQKLSENPLVVYAGSPERIDFGEEKEDKGFVLVNIKITADQNLVTNHQFIQTNCRKFLTITVDLKTNETDPTQTILEEIKKHHIEDTVVRVIINIPTGMEKEIEMDQIKKILSGAHFIAGISKNIERQERTKIDGQQQIERLTPIEALRKYLEAKKSSAEKVKQLENYAAQLLE